MKRAVLLMMVLWGWAFAAVAEEYKEGVDYELVVPPQPVADPAKIEVMEFFWYGCPHCLSFEPVLNAWVGKLPKDVQFIRQPAVFNDIWAAHAKAFFTAEALGVADKTHADFFTAIQAEHKDPKKVPLLTEDELAPFFVSHGVAEDAFRQAYHSFAVDTRQRQAQAMGPAYGITGTPTLVVNGKYRITGQKAKSQPNMLVIADYLIAKERGAARH